jgi:hypothetical protein
MVNRATARGPREFPPLRSCAASSCLPIFVWSVYTRDGTHLARGHHEREKYESGKQITYSVEVFSIHDLWVLCTGVPRSAESGVLASSLAPASISPVARKGLLSKKCD